MQHHDHVNLLRGGSPHLGGVWADLGAGSGAFTLALAELQGPGAVIYAIDQDLAALRENERAMAAHFPAVTLHTRRADFTGALDLPALDGLLMANSLHFHRDKAPLLRRLLTRLKPGGCFLLVEYNVDQGNMWVPHPLSYRSWHILAQQVGLIHTRQIASVPSRFLKEIYSAVSLQASASKESLETGWRQKVVKITVVDSHDSSDSSDSHQSFLRFTNHL